MSLFMVTVHYTSKQWNISFSGRVSSAPYSSPFVPIFEFLRMERVTPSGYTPLLVYGPQWSTHQLPVSFPFYTHSSFSEPPSLPYLHLSLVWPAYLTSYFIKYILSLTLLHLGSNCSNVYSSFLQICLSFCSRQTPSSLWSHWYWLLPPRILYSLHISSLILFLLLSWLLFRPLPLPTFKYRVPQVCHGPLLTLTQLAWSPH